MEIFILHFQLTEHWLKKQKRFSEKGNFSVFARYGVDAICGLSLLLVLSLAPRGFSPRTTVSPSPQKPTLPNSNSTRNQVDEEPLCGCATFKSLFISYLLYHPILSVITEYITLTRTLLGSTFPSSICTCAGNKAEKRLQKSEHLRTFYILNLTIWRHCILLHLLSVFCQGQYMELHWDKPIRSQHLLPCE